MFYANPTDPRIFVPKPDGLGITLNLAHPISWVMIAALAVVVVFLSYQRRRRKGK